MSMINDGIMFALLLLGLVLYFLLTERLLARFFSRPAENDGLRGIRRRGMIQALVLLAPLLGLLGTVNGMIATFYGMDGGAVSQHAAQGIFTALYSTEYGLALAIPAFLLMRLLK